MSTKIAPGHAERRIDGGAPRYTLPSGADPVTGETADDLAELARSDQYRDLRRILCEAFRFASEEKGHERHGMSGEGWSTQRHAAIAREVGTGFAIGQAVKKSYESEGLDSIAAKRELLGAITYLASAIYAIERNWR